MSYNREHEHKLDFFSSTECVLNLIDASCSANDVIPSYFLHNALAILRNVLSILVFSLDDVSIMSSMCLEVASFFASLRETCRESGLAVAMSFLVPMSIIKASGPGLEEVVV